MAEEILNKLREFEATSMCSTKQRVIQEDFLKFLVDTASIEYIPIDASFFPTITITSVLFPKRLLKKINPEELVDWHGCDSCWGVVRTPRKKSQILKTTIVHPFEDAQPEILQNSSPIVYYREFDGKLCIELDQIIAHVHDLHYEHAQKYYGRIYDGEIEKSIKIITEDPSIEDIKYNKTLVLAKQNLLDEHMLLFDTILIRLFDLTICGKSFHWSGCGEVGFIDNWHNKNIYAKYERQNDASYIRGYQIIESSKSKKEITTFKKTCHFVSKKYVEFIAYDFKNNKIQNCSCDPEKLGNYFVESTLPFGTSPVFFKPEVLSRYRQDTDKYCIKNNRSISCKEHWSLERMGINSNVQVFTLLIDLAHLPYEEQLYWKSFNQEPKKNNSLGSDGLENFVSEDFFKRCYSGEYGRSDQISKLKRNLHELENQFSKFWTCINDDYYDQLNIPLIASSNEPANFCGILHKLIIEGFNEKYLKQKLRSLGVSDKEMEKLKSISLIKEIAVKNSLTAEVEDALQPLLEINNWRVAWAHVKRKESTEQCRNDILAKHGSIKNYCEELITRLNETIIWFLELLKQKIL